MSRRSTASEGQSPLVEAVAGNGLLDRRFFIKQSVALFGVGGLGAVARSARAADPTQLPPWMQFPGAGMSSYGSPAKYESKVVRALIQSKPGTTGSGASRTPIESLDGMITPNGLHFERHHSGVP